MLERALVLVAVGAVEDAVAFKFAIDELADELIAAGIAAPAGAVGFAVGKLALVLAAVFQLQMAIARELVILEVAAIAQGTLLERAFALAVAQLEPALVGAVVGRQAAMAAVQALGEIAAIAIAIASVPLALAVPLAIFEIPCVPITVRVVDTALAI